MTCSIMPRVGLHQGQLRRRIEFERDGLAEQALEHLGQVADHFAQVERLGLHDVLAAEHQQLAGQAGGALGGEVDRLGGIEQLGRQVGLGQQHPGVALDDGEHVVEVVRHAGGQLADGLHLLRLPQLRFQVQPLGDVLDVAMHHLAGGHRMERPGKGAALRIPFAGSARSGPSPGSCGQCPRRWAAASRADGPGRRSGELERGVIEIGDGAVAVSSMAGLGFNWAKAASFCNSLSARIRSTAIASTVASEKRKWISSSVKLRWRAVYAPSTPKACPCPAIATLMPLTTPWSASKRRAAEAGLLWQVLERHRLAGRQREPGFASAGPPE